MLRLWLILISSSILLASQAHAQASMGGSSGFYAWGGPAQLERPTDVTQRTTALKNKAQPSDDLSEIMTELQAIPYDLSVNDQWIASIQSQSINKDDVQRAKTDVIAIIARIKTANCDDRAFPSVANELRMQMGQAGRFGLQPPGFMMLPDNDCEAFKNGVNSLNPEQWFQPALGRSEQMSQLLDAYNAHGIAIKTREGQLNAKMHELVEGKNLTSTFILFIVAFGLLALGVIFIVSRYFSEALQEEWIGSGQITQFVTVMILLTVITMLGLSKVLNTDTLGTLLGGVAGYVLAQGVGRQAARDALRQPVQPPSGG